MADDIFPKKYSFSCGLICHSLQGKEKAGLKQQSLQPSIKNPSNTWNKIQIRKPCTILVSPNSRFKVRTFNNISCSGLFISFWIKWMWHLDITTGHKWILLQEWTVHNELSVRNWTHRWIVVQELHFPKSPPLPSLYFYANRQNFEEVTSLIASRFN